MSIDNEAELLDVVKKLRQYTNALDNAHFLAGKIKILKDSALTHLATKVMVDVDEAAAGMANLLRHIEGSVSYRDVVRKFKAPTGTKEENDDE